MAVQVGQQFPPFTAATQDGGTLDLASFQGKRNLVVFFYPKASTPGCTLETTDFGRRAGEFDALNTQLIGVSVDEPGANQKHAVTCGSNFPLLSDEGGRLIEQLDIKNERGSAKRTTYVVDTAGKVRTIFPNVKVDGHTDEVLAAVRQL